MPSKAKTKTRVAPKKSPARAAVRSKTTKPARTAKAAKPAKPSKPSKPSKPARPAKPAPAQVSAVAPGYTAVTPYLICAGAAEALEFYKKAFGAVELMRMPGPNGKLMHAEMEIGGARVMLADEAPDWGCVGPKALNGSPVTIYLYVNDVDLVVARAAEVGAKVTMPVQDMFWGDRYGKVEDPFGHQWSVATHLRDMTPAEMAEAAQKAFAEMSPPPAPTA